MAHVDIQVGGRHLIRDFSAGPSSDEGIHRQMKNVDEVLNARSPGGGWKGHMEGNVIERGAAAEACA